MSIVALPVDDPIGHYDQVELDEYVLQIFTWDQKVYFPREEQVTFRRRSDGRYVTIRTVITVADSCLRIGGETWISPVWVQPQIPAEQEA